MIKTTKLSKFSTDYSWLERPESNADEQTMRLKRMIGTDLALLMGQTLSERLFWTKSQTALVEACYAAFEGATFLDPNYQPLKFKDVIRRVFSVLHRPVPKNPWSNLRQARIRKNKNKAPLMERYRQMAICHGVEHPIMTDVSVRMPSPSHRLQPIK